jgi:GH24 family phage-related lysozyme (muramidase)
LSVGDFFNQHVVPSIDALDRLAAPVGGGDDIDLDGEDKLAAQRRQRQAQLNQQEGLFSDPFQQGVDARRTRDGGDPTFTTAGGVDALPERSGGPFDPPAQGERIFDLPSRSKTTSSTAPSGDLTSFVKRFEGYSSKAFDDFKQTSIGYGTKARKGEKTITKAEAEKRLGAELASHRARVLAHNKKHNLNLNSQQIDALTSFDYNTGRLNQLTAGGTRTKAQIAAKIPEYKKAGGKTLRGLVRRRKAEQQLFNSKK